MMITLLLHNLFVFAAIISYTLVFKLITKIYLSRNCFRQMYHILRLMQSSSKNRKSVKCVPMCKIFQLKNSCLCVCVEKAGEEVFVKHVTEVNSRTRGLLRKGGWISIENHMTNKVFAERKPDPDFTTVRTKKKSVPHCQSSKFQDL